VEEYLVELYLPRGDATALADAAFRARAASEQLTGEGRNIRYVRSIFVPQDEICFHLYEAEEAAVVREASQRACIAHERVVRAVSVPGRSPGQL
jgi:hypothetical protein